MSSSGLVMCGRAPTGANAEFELRDQSRIAIIGGGPAGAFLGYFLLELARRIGMELGVDIYEAKDFSLAGPGGCNMCGGIISESLVQALATEGIDLPPEVIIRGIDSYMLHMDVGSVRIETPLHELRIGAVHRGAGPRGMTGIKSRGFDGYLLDLAQNKGARLLRGRVQEVAWEGGRPRLKAHGVPEQPPYDLLGVATGVNASSARLFTSAGLKYKPPQVARTYISEMCLGREAVQKLFGHSMHVFLLDIPRLEFAALIPKGDFVTFCMLGDDIDDALVQAFFAAEPVRRCLPADFNPAQRACHCSPRINVQSAVEPYADRVVFIGDCGTSRLYKDGIGAAYRTAKAAAVTAVFQGVSAADFGRHFWPACRAIRRDNRVGKLVFAASRIIQKQRSARRGILRMVQREQQRPGGHRRMSKVLWNTFTGSAPYAEIFLDTLHPGYWGRLLRETVSGLWSAPAGQPAVGQLNNLQL